MIRANPKSGKWLRIKVIKRCELGGGEHFKGPYLVGDLFRESNSRVETSADGSAPSGQHINPGQARFDSLDAKLDLLNVPAEFLPQSERRRVLETSSELSVFHSS